MFKTFKNVSEALSWATDENNTENRSYDLIGLEAILSKNSICKMDGVIFCVDEFGLLDEPNKSMSVHYRICDANHPMYHSSKFDTIEEAIEVRQTEYIESDNEYWRNRPQKIEKVTTIIEIVA